MKLNVKAKIAKMADMCDTAHTLVFLIERRSHFASTPAEHVV
jgi:hypothetical protein